MRAISYLVYVYSTGRASGSGGLFSFDPIVFLRGGWVILTMILTMTMVVSQVGYDSGRSESESCVIAWACGAESGLEESVY